MKMLALLGIFIFSFSALAMNGRTTYQAKIIKPDGYPLEAASVTFKFVVLDAAASCVLYSEVYSAINMTATGGLISFALGGGVRSFPPASATTAIFSNVFDNSITSMPCEAAGIYNPLPNDTRRVVMQFNDGLGWQTLPAMTINAVPYAMYANKSNDSKTLNSKADTDFVEYSTLAGLSCAADQAIKFNGVSFSCITVGVGSSGITSVTTSGTVLSTGGTASAPVISIQAATLSQDGYLTSLDYAEFKAKLSASSTEIINTLGYTPVSSSTVASQIASSTLSGDVSGNPGSNTVNSVGGKTAVQISTSVDATLAATASNTTGTLVKRDASGNFTANDIYANAAKINYADIYRPSTSFNIRLQAPTSLSTNYVLNLPTTSGTTGQVLSTDGSGNLSWISPTTGSVVSVSATAPLASTGGSNPTISITQATSSTDGYLSSTDWNTFNNKQQATSAAIITTLGYTPADSATTVSSQWNTVGTTINYVAGNVGIGSTTPSNKLTVAGNANFTGNVGIGTTTPNGPLHIYGSGRPRIESSGNPAYLDLFGGFGNPSARNYAVSVNAAALGNFDILQSPSSGIDPSVAVLSINASGSVGVGIVNPSAKLHLASGTVSVAPLKFTSGTLLSSPQSGTMEYDGANFYLTDNTNTRRSIATGSSAGTIDNASNINSSGNITLTPTGSVVVSSTTASTNSSTGALVVKGGLGVAENINASGTIITSSNIQGASITATAGMITPYVYGSVVSGGSLRLDSTTHATKGNILLAPSGGNIGVGTVNPSLALHAAGTNGFPATSGTAQTGGLRVGSTVSQRVLDFGVDGGTSTAWMQSTTMNNLNNANSLAINPNGGNVGVGTATPGAAFQVGENTVSSSAFRFAPSGDQSSMRFTTNALANWIQSGVDFTGDSKKDLRFSSINGVTTWMTVQGSTGNVGIGTTSPQSMLHITRFTGSNGNIIIDGDSSTTGKPRFFIVDTNGGSVTTSPAFQIYNTNDLFTIGRSSNINTGPVDVLSINNSGNMGVGTTTPQEKLHVSGTMLVSGEWGSGASLAVSGAGTRMFFYPKKAAFRAGFAWADEWDDSKIGEASVAMGNESAALAYGAIALGTGTYASGTNSVAMGKYSQATGDRATAFGESQATGDLSTSFDSSYAAGYYSVAMGSSSANADRSISIGQGSNANGQGSIAIGRSINANSYYGVAVGSYNIGNGSGTAWVATDSIFEVGNSQNGSPRSNAMTILKNGNVGLVISSPTARLHLASGTTALAPLKFTSGTLLSSPQSGTMEYDGANFYLTDNTNTRRTIATGSSAGTIDNASNINSSGNITLTPTGSVVVSSTTASTNSSTGALVVKGGLGVAGNIYSSGTIITSSNIQGVSVTATSGMISPYIAGSVASSGSLTLDSTTHATKGNILLAPNGGNVGIGTTTPGYKLSVYEGAAGVVQNIESGNNGSTAYTRHSGKTDGGSTRTFGTGLNISDGTGGYEVYDFTAGTSRMFINSSGNIGVGTLAPASRLHIQTGSTLSLDGAIISTSLNANDGLVLRPDSGAANANPLVQAGDKAIIFSDGSVDTGNLVIGNWSNTATGMRITSTGNVGIGTAAPVEKLHVNGTAILGSIPNYTNGGSGLYLANEAGDAFNFFRIDGYANDLAIVASSLTGAASGTSISFRTSTAGQGVNGTTKMIIDSAGNVGVGTTNPISAKLHLQSSSYGGTPADANNRLKIESSGHSYIGLYSPNTFDQGIHFGDPEGEQVGRITYRHSTDMMQFRTNAAERMVIDSSGNVGIGTTAPTAKLEVAGDIVGQAQVFRAYLSAPFSKSVSWEKIPFNVTYFNTLQGTFDTINNRFTASRSGYYQVGVSGYSSASSASGDRYGFALLKNGVQETITGGNYSAVDTPFAPLSTIVYMNGTTDYIEIHMYSAIAATLSSGATGYGMQWNMSYLGK